ncbi:MULTISPECIES: transporter substrate-binding domain-containing protein [unclassified Pantoea]|uniref:ATP-binding protein n=1 Tax=unclassified Pantoea TaxID=2630326 RepID=UPI001231A355|nr:MULTISPECIES: transporter substrate-binding domain-containing protein [unclassified Pantoea]KAA6094567.1 transporter substrate-binding domain-containing protein [Pantoea sp. B_9]KAA6109904.1 transporter substrate-binding domain-containing protein [Pantoea sp. B_10]
MIRLLMFIGLVLCCSSTVAQPMPQLYIPLEREPLAPLIPQLSQDDWQALRQLPTLRIALWAPDIPPYLTFLDMSSEEKNVEGVFADYARLIGQALGMRIEMQRYADRDAALAAIAADQADMLFSKAGNTVPANAQLDASQNLLINRPVVVTQRDRAMQPVPYAAPVRLAVDQHYLSDSVIRAQFPQAHIMRYASSRVALSALATGEADYVLDNLTSASFLIERNYLNQLALADILAPRAQDASRLLVSQRRPVMLRAINRVIAAIPAEQHRAISRQWTQRPDIWRLQQPLALTAAEQRWLQQHGSVRVGFNPFFAPLALLDGRNQFQGISAELLHQIHLRTGINFVAVPEYHEDSLLMQLQQHKIDMLAALSYNAQWPGRFTQPWLHTPFVLITAATAGAPAALHSGLRISVMKGSPVIGWLQQHYPEVQLQLVDNASLGMQQVVEGKADGMVHNQLGAAYLIKRYFSGRMRIVQRVGTQPAHISFAVHAGDPELLSIMNKALNEILPSEISQLTSRWQGTPEVTASSWPLYRTPFYALAGVAAVVSLACLLWVYQRGREIRRRRRAQRQLQIARDRADRENQAKSRWVATVSHEIRNPVNAIIGLLALEARKAGASEALLTAWQSAQALSGLVGDILDMAKIERGQLTLAPQWHSIATLCQPVLQLYQGLAHEKNLTLSYHTTLPDLEVWVDAPRLRQVIANYISNAIKFTPQGSVAVYLSGEQNAAGELVLEIEVQDSGIGISEQEQQQLFQPFAQATAGRQQTGCGLGLVISAQLLQQMQGSMRLHSEPGEGTLVNVTLPLPSRAPPPVTLRATDAPPAMPALHILVVDDHPANCLLLTRQLEALQHRVTAIGQPDLAPEIIATQQIDAVITDCHMPQMDGFTLTSVLRRRGYRHKIIGLTGSALAETRERGLAAGMDACLFKPLHPDQLNAALAQPAALPALLSLPQLRAMVHHDDDMVAKLLLRVCEENQRDLQQAQQELAQQQWPALARTLHRLAGAAQIIYAADINQLCQQLEQDCVDARDGDLLSVGLAGLTTRIEQLQLAIDCWLPFNRVVKQ